MLPDNWTKEQYLAASQAERDDYSRRVMRAYEDVYKYADRKRDIEVQKDYDEERRHGWAAGV